MTAARCKSCGAGIFWCKTENEGRNIPVDAQQAFGGNINILPGGVARVGNTGSGIFVSHFATCPNARAHRRKRSSSHEERQP
jgi:hypothetical protein